jgi:hypothetical protein
MLSLEAVSLLDNRIDLVAMVVVVTDRIVDAGEGEVVPRRCDVLWGIACAKLSDDEPYGQARACNDGAGAAGRSM